MPHCIIEYAKSLETRVKPSTIIDAVLQGSMQSELFQPNDIKVRAMAFEHHRSPATVQNFIHVTVKLLSGRDQQQRAMLAEKVLSQLDRIALSSVSISVDVVSMDKETYAKVVK